MTEDKEEAGPKLLEARLWGTPRFVHCGAVVEPTSSKALALLAYLVAEDRLVARDELAVLLWGPGRLANVRQALYQLRALPGAGEWLIDGDQRISVRAVSELSRLVGAPEDAAPELVDSLDGEEFLAGIEDGLPGPYLDWLARERVQTAKVVGAALSSRAAELEEEGDLARSLVVVARLQALDPYDDAVQRAAMRLSYLAGEAERALASYAEFAGRLRAELGSEPAPETGALALLIENREAVAPRTSLAALTEAERRILQALGLARGALKLDGLARVLERPAFEMVADLTRLESRGFIDEHLSLLPDLSSAVTASVPVALGRLIHERIAAVLLAEHAADQGALARHLLAAGDRAEAARRGLNAARAALERDRRADAVDLLYLTLWASQGEPKLRLEACLALEDVAAGRADFELQDALLIEIERLAWELQSDSALAEGNLRRARLLLGRGNVGEALELALTALATALRIGDATLVARSRNAIGAAHFFAGDLDGAASSFIYNLECGDEVEKYRAHNNLGSIHAMRGELDASHRHFDQALTLARLNANHLDVSATLNNVAASAERLGDYPRAEKHFREGLALARREGAGRREAEMLVNLAVVYARQGQLGPAWNTTEEVDALAAELGDRRLAMRVAEQRAEILVQCGDLETAIAEFGAAVQLAAELGDERKRQLLGAQQLTARARLERVLLPEAAAAVTELERARLLDTVSWLRLELALSSADLVFSQGQLDLVIAAKPRGIHQELLCDVVRMRLGLLLGADAAVLAASEAARQRLMAAAVLPTEEAVCPEIAGRFGPQRVAIVERPLALFLSQALLAVFRGQSGEAPDKQVAAVQVELSEQAAGLPTKLKRTLLLAPLRWRASLDEAIAGERDDPLS